MAPDHDTCLRTSAEIIIRLGVNLQPGQHLLIAEPYELQGVSREANAFIETVSTVVLAAGCPAPEIIWGDASRLRHFAEQADWPGFTQLVSGQTRQMKAHLDTGGAFLFPLTSSPRLMEGIAPENVGELRRIAWQHFGPIIQRLTAGESQWTIVPAPTPTWAETAFVDLPAEQRLGALAETVFSALRILTVGGALRPDPSRDKPAPTSNPLHSWQTHLQSLTHWRETLNARRHKFIRYQGPGTDLTVKLPSSHRWCTAQLTTANGLPFVANLPTEEVFTAPDRNSAEGIVRVCRPINYGGAVIEGIELVFKQGCVVEARARTGSGLLKQLLNTDEGSNRLGEVAIVENPATETTPESALSGQLAPSTHWQSSGRLFYHTLLDENASNHIALGEAYRFCSNSPFAFGLNRSLVHVDLPLDARVTLT